MSPEISQGTRTDVPFQSQLKVEALLIENTLCLNTCYFISDTQPPVIDFCESPPDFITATDDVDIEWDEPLFHDNSREPLTITQTHKFGRFPFGDTEVTDMAIDKSGNSATCKIHIRLASKLRTILN